MRIGKERKSPEKQMCQNCMPTMNVNLCLLRMSQTFLMFLKKKHRNKNNTLVIDHTRIALFFNCFISKLLMAYLEVPFKAGFLTNISWFSTQFSLSRKWYLYIIILSHSNALSITFFIQSIFIIHNAYSYSTIYIWKKSMSILTSLCSIHPANRFQRLSNCRQKESDISRQSIQLFGFCKRCQQDPHGLKEASKMEMPIHIL